MIHKAILSKKTASTGLFMPVKHYDIMFRFYEIYDVPREIEGKSDSDISMLWDIRRDIPELLELHEGDFSLEVRSNFKTVDI